LASASSWKHGCQTLDRKYGKCLEKKIGNGNVCGDIHFSLQYGNSIAILISQVFAIHIFSILLNFLSLTIKKRSVLWESKFVLSRRNMSSVKFSSVVLKVGGSPFEKIFRDKGAKKQRR